MMCTHISFINIQTSRSEDIEIETFFRLGKIDSVVSENEIIVIPLDLPKCSINTDNVVLREKGVVNCTVYPQKNKMIRIMYRRIVIRGELFAENIEEILILENEEIVECVEKKLPEASNYRLNSEEEEDPQDSDSEEVFLTKSLSDDIQDVEDSSDEDCVGRDTSTNNNKNKLAFNTWRNGDIIEPIAVPDSEEVLLTKSSSEDVQDVEDSSDEECVSGDTSYKNNKSKFASNTWRNGDIIETIAIPGNKVGLVIGKGGNTISAICRDSGAHCHVDKQSPWGAREKNIIIKGKSESIERAKEMIFEKVGRRSVP